MQYFEESFRKNMLRTFAVVGVLLVLASSSFVLISASAVTYPVALKVSPTSSSFPPGGSPSETLKVTNNGRAAFTAKTCNLVYTGPFTGKKTAVCPTTFTSFTVKPGATFTHLYKSFPFRVPTKAPKGTYHFTVTLDGTVTGSPVTTMSTTFDITVT